MLLRRLEEVDSLYCFFLGRRAESIKVIERHLYTSIFEAIQIFTSSIEFSQKIGVDDAQYSRLSIQDWHGILDLFCRAQILRSNGMACFVNMRDVEDAKQPINFLYWELFRRPPDDEGLKNHLQAMAMGTTISEIIGAMTHSEEGNYRDYTFEISDQPQAEIASECNRQYIAMAFSMILNRTVDGSGMRHHQISLDTNQIDRNSLFESVFASVEAQALRRHRPGGETIVWNELVVKVFRSPSIAYAVETLKSPAAQQLKMLLERLVTPHSQPLAPSLEHVVDERGRPAILTESAASIYEALI